MSEARTDSGSSRKENVSEYQQQFVWSRPLVERLVVQPEPLTSQYQRDYKHWPLEHNNDMLDALSLSTTSIASSSNSLDKQRKARSSISFGHDATKVTPVNRSEYHDKFKSFTEYVLVEGDGFRPETPAETAADTIDSPKAWLHEVEERCRQACKYRARSQMGIEARGEHVWDGVKLVDRDLQALALATKLIIEDKRDEKKLNGAKERSVSAKPFNRKSSKTLSSAPARWRDPSFNTESVPKSIRGRKTITPSKENEDPVDRNNNAITKDNDSSKQAKVSNKKVAEPASTKQNNSTSKIAGGGEKVWIKPKKAEDKKPAATSGDRGSKEAAKVVARKKSVETPRKSPPVEVRSVPLRTTKVRPPEELSGMKSPSPESWKVSLEKGGLNWVNGGATVGGAQQPPVLPPPVQLEPKLSSSSNANTVLNEADLIKPVPINGRN